MRESFVPKCARQNIGKGAAIKMSISAVILPLIRSPKWPDQHITVLMC
jgi:hypothetical protein